VCDGFVTAWGGDAGSSICLRVLCSGSGWSRRMAGACWSIMRWCRQKELWEHDLTSCLLKEEDEPLFLSKKTPKKDGW